MGIKEDRELADDLCEIECGLTEWEVQFVEDIASQVHDAKRALSPAQRSKALEIQERRRNADDE